VSSVAILSPHLDDAVFSCWHVLASSRDVVVINVFTGIPPPRSETPAWDRITGAHDPAERMRARLQEDKAALALVDRRAENLDFLESQYRGDDVPQIGDVIRKVLPDDVHLLAPAGIGGHSDHELVRDAALALGEQGRDLALYTDLPYATEFGWPAWMTGAAADPFRDVDAFWARFVPDGYEPRPVELDEELQSAKVKAMRVYRSQFAALEGDSLQRLTHPDLVRFELVWTRADGSYTGPTAGL
jgi:LmbE family N-acetylglucosaminyl deacetylase